MFNNIYHVVKQNMLIDINKIVYPGAPVESPRLFRIPSAQRWFSQSRTWAATSLSSRTCGFLGRLRAAGTVPKLGFSFTYKLDNFREMPEFVDFCPEMNCDLAIFERLQNICFPVKEYCTKANHPLPGEFLSIVANPIFASQRVWYDFDYKGAAKLTAEEARQRFIQAQP